MSTPCLASNPWLCLAVCLRKAWSRGRQKSQSPRLADSQSRNCKLQFRWETLAPDRQSMLNLEHHTDMSTCTHVCSHVCHMYTHKPGHRCSEMDSVSWVWWPGPRIHTFMDFQMNGQLEGVWEGGCHSLHLFSRLFLRFFSSAAMLYLIRGWNEPANNHGPKPLKQSQHQPPPPFSYFS